MSHALVLAKLRESQPCRLGRDHVYGARTVDLLAGKLSVGHPWRNILGQ